jgi:hypothetical protein
MMARLMRGSPARCGRGCWGGRDATRAWPPASCPAESAVPILRAIPPITNERWRETERERRGRIESRLEGGVNRAKLKFTKLITTTSRVSVRNNNESEREGAKQIASE